MKTTQTIQIETPYLGVKEKITSFSNEENIRLTNSQQQIVKTIVDNHLMDTKYIVNNYDIFVCKYFVAIHIWYFPKDAHNTVYTLTRKTIYVGPKGAIKKFTCATGLGKDRNLKDIWRYYIKADER